MGEEKPQEEEGKEEKKDEEKKGEENKEDTNPEIVLKVDMHCEACARKVARALKGFEGVEEVSADSRASKVVVKGKAADPAKVCERLQKKSGRKVELISPLPTPPPAAEEKKEEPKQEEKLKDEPPIPITLVLKIRMHCEACAQVLQKRIRKIKGVKSVETDVFNDLVTVTGILEATKFVNDVFKRTRKQAIIIPNEEKKAAEKEEEEKNESKKLEEKKEGGNGDATAVNPNDQTSTDVKRTEYWPSKMYSEYAFAYPPQMFSDENPHACSLM